MEDNRNRNLKLNDELVSEIESYTEKKEEIQEPEEEKTENDVPKRRNLIWIPITLGGILLAVAVVFYINKALSFKKIYMPETYINTIDASGKTPDELREEIRILCNDHTVRISARGREPEIIGASDVGLHYITGDEPDIILSEQKIWRWPFESQQIKIFDIDTMAELDDSKLAEVCNRLKAFDDSTASAPVDAKLGEFDPAQNAFAVIKEDDGNILTDKVQAVNIIKEAILTLKPSVNLEDNADRLYSKAEIRSDNENILAEKEKLDVFVKPKVVYQGHNIVLDGKTLQDWIVTDSDGSMHYDDNKIKNFVSMIAAEYDTLGLERTLVTQYGNSTRVKGGDFGWKVDQEAEIKELKSALKEGSEVSRDPVFTSKGISHGDNDWGDTYVEINLAKQHLFFVKNGKLIVSSDIVSGGLQRKAPTPTGVYDINAKGRNVVLRGPRRADGSYQWESPVTYWMPFNKGIGLHDANWRGSFGGKIYRVNGSHGCVNLPFKKAKAIFEEISTGVPVIVYDDDFEIMNMPTDPEEEQKRIEAEKKAEQAKIEAEAKKAIKVPDPEKETKKEKKKETVKKPVQTVPAETAAPETQAQETLPAETAPIEWGPGFDRSTQGESTPESTQAETQAEVIPLQYTTVTTGVENVPGDM